MTSDQMRISTVGGAQLIALTLPETVDSESFDQLNESVFTALDKKPAGRWVIDLSQVSYMGSAVLGLMVNARQRIRSSGGKLVLCGLSPRLQNIFHACCLEKLFTISPNQESALVQAQCK